MSEGSSPAPARLYALLALLAVVWSANFVFAKIALRELEPMTLGMVRFSLAGLFILPIYLWKKGVPKSYDPLRARFLAVSVVCIGINQLMFVSGLSRTSVAHSALILALTPVWVLLMARMLGHEPVTVSKLVGLAIAISGVGVLQTRHSPNAESSMFGDLLIFGASITWAGYTVASKWAREHLDSLTMNTITYGGTALVFLPLTAWFAWPVEFSRLSLTVWSSLIYMAIFPTLVGVAIYYHCMRFMSASRISMIAYAQPLLATAFAVLMLGESISQAVVWGGVLVLAGVVWTERC